MPFNNIFVSVLDTMKYVYQKNVKTGTYSALTLAKLKSNTEVTMCF